MKKKNLFIIFILVVVIGVVYNLNRTRKSPTEGFRCGSQKIPDSSLKNYYILRFDTLKGIDNKTVKKPLYAILWKARPADTANSSSWHLVRLITAGKISIPKKEKAIYSLQPDFTLSILPLKEVELNALFDLFLSARKKEPFYKNSVWQSQIAPNLIIVEVPDK
jgi:hypothetical protein